MSGGSTPASASAPVRLSMAAMLALRRSRRDSSTSGVEQLVAAWMTRQRGAAGACTPQGLAQHPLYRGLGRWAFLGRGARSPKEPYRAPYSWTTSSKSERLSPKAA